MTVSARRHAGPAAFLTSLAAHGVVIIAIVAWLATTDESPAATLPVARDEAVHAGDAVPLEATPTDLVLVPLRQIRPLDVAKLEPPEPPPKPELAKDVAKDVAKPVPAQLAMRTAPQPPELAPAGGFQRIVEREAQRQEQAARQRGVPGAPGDAPDLSRSVDVQRILERHAEVAPGTPPPAAPLQPGSASHANDKLIRDLEVKKLANPTFYEAASPERVAQVQAEVESLRREREALAVRPIGGGRYRNERMTYRIDIDPDGSVHIQDKPNVQLDGAGLRFDINDAIMRSAGADPYARAKLHFLDKTRDERAELGMGYRSAQLGKSQIFAKQNIDRLWATTTNVAARKQGMFDLWDECAETGDTELVEGGRAARALIVGEIRARLRGADAYTADELRRFNADPHKHSKAPFTPYE